MLNRVSADIVDFLKKHHVAILATASLPSATPQAATIFYTTDSKLNLYFLTKEDTTKNKNLTANPQTALVVLELETLKTAQIIGRAAKVDDPDMMQRAQELMARFSNRIAQTPNTPISKLDAGSYVLYCVTPQSIRLADYKYGTGDAIFDVAAPAEESLE